MADFKARRDEMVERQIEARGIRNAALLAAMRAVPREKFVPDHLHAHAHDDSPLPIEEGQTISQPYIVALMIEAAGVKAGDRVLEIGAGSGYAAAVLGRLATAVFAVERHRALGALARERIRALGYDNVTIVEGDGTLGLPSEAPFDAIIAAASGPDVPEILLGQLACGGRLVMPLGEPGAVQRLVKVQKVEGGRFQQEELGEVRFVPLIGAYGWQDS